MNYAKKFCSIGGRTYCFGEKLCALINKRTLVRGITSMAFALFFGVSVAMAEVRLVPNIGGSPNITGFKTCGPNQNILTKHSHVYAIWSRTGRLLATYGQTSGGFFGAACAADGLTYFSVADYWITQFDLASGTSVRFKTNESSSEIEYVPTENALLLSSYGLINHLNLKTKEETLLLKINPDLKLMAVSPDGELLVAFLYSKSALLFDLKNRKEIGSLGGLFSGHGWDIYGTKFSEDSQVIVTQSRGDFCIWNRAGDLIRKIETSLASLDVFRGDIITLDSSGEIRVYDLAGTLSYELATGPVGSDKGAVFRNSESQNIVIMGSNQTIEIGRDTPAKIVSRSGHPVMNLELLNETELKARLAPLTYNNTANTDTGIDLVTGKTKAYQREKKILVGDLPVIPPKFPNSNAEIPTVHPLGLRAQGFFREGKVWWAGIMFPAEIRLFDPKTQSLIAKLFFSGENEYLVATSDGRFDYYGNADAMAHWVEGEQVISLNSLKDKYYTPGLLAEIITGKNPNQKAGSAKNDKASFSLIGRVWQRKADGSVEVMLGSQRTVGIGGQLKILKGKNYVKCRVRNMFHTKTVCDGPDTKGVERGMAVFK